MGVLAALGMCSSRGVFPLNTFAQKFITFLCLFIIWLLPDDCHWAHDQQNNVEIFINVMKTSLHYWTAPRDVLTKPSWYTAQGVIQISSGGASSLGDLLSGEPSAAEMWREVGCTMNFSSSAETSNAEKQHRWQEGTGRDQVHCWIS